jgi:hypothetical protein
MNPSVVDKSTFEIHNKKYITVGYLVGKEISVVILIGTSKNVFTLDLLNWNDLMNETNFNLILNNLQNRTKSSVSLNENLCYSINAKYFSITLRLDNNSITLNIIDLCRLKQIQICIDSYIIEKQKKISFYQNCFNLFYNSLKQSVSSLPISCQSNAFIYQYIQNYIYDTNLEGMSLICEIQQYQFATLSNLLLKDLYQ